MDLHGKTVFVSGASSGIGRAVALALGHRQNRLAITARRRHLLDTLAQEITAAGGECLTVAADALDDRQATAAVDRAIERFGKIDAALLNVGDGPAFEMSTAPAVEVTANMRVNYDSLVHYLMPLIAHMKNQQGGLIAHTNSLAGFLGLPRQGPYSAAKSACRILIDTCRIELADRNIRFVSLHPGFVATQRVADDGIPAPLEITEQTAASHIIWAMEKEKRDYLFPLSMRWLIRLARVLPKPVVGRITAGLMDDSINP